MAWFSKLGAIYQRFNQGITATGLAAVLFGCFYPQTLGLKRYQNLVAFYKDGIAVPVDSETQQLVEKVFYRMNMPMDDEERITFFTSFPKDPLHKGSSQIRTGALIGLPWNFSCRTVSDLDCSSVLVGVDGKEVDWNTPAAEDLRNALVLGDRAKAFVIGREISYVQSFSVFVDLVLQNCFCLFAYYCGRLLNQTFMLTLRLKPWARFVTFSSVAVAWLLMYIAVDDAVHCWYDNKVDEAIAKLRKVYAEGGVEYYNAVLRQNCALRTLQGTEGARHFTRYGNVVSVWRNPTVQLTSRRDNLLKYLAEYEEQDTVPRDADLNTHVPHAADPWSDST